MQRHHGGIYVSKNCHKKKRRYGTIRWIFILAVACYLLLMVESKIRPILRTVIEYESREYAVTCFNEAVQSHLQRYPDAYQNLYEVTWDETGLPTAVLANSYAINLLRSQLAQEVLVQLFAKKDDVYDFRLGRLTGVQMLATHGPVIILEMDPKSYVIATIYHTIETEGENQTLLSVYAKFTVQISVSMSGYLQTLTVENDVLLWQNLLLGRVPDVNV